MTEYDEQLQEDFKRFRDMCIELRNVFNTFRALYESGDDETEKALKATAHLFFDDLNKWLIEIIFVHIGRLLDPASTGGNENLSVCWIVEEVRKAGKRTQDINDLAAALMCYREKIKPARNKILSHADVKVFRDGQRLGEHTESEALGFFEYLQRFTDEVGRAIGVGPLDYRCQPGSGDVTDLIRVLKKAARK